VDSLEIDSICRAVQSQQDPRAGTGCKSDLNCTQMDLKETGTGMGFEDTQVRLHVSFHFHLPLKMDLQMAGAVETQMEMDLQIDGRAVGSKGDGCAHACRRI